MGAQRAGASGTKRAGDFDAARVRTAQLRRNCSRAAYSGEYRALAFIPGARGAEKSVAAGEGLGRGILWNEMHNTRLMPKRGWLISTANWRRGERRRSRRI